MGNRRHIKEKRIRLTEQLISLRADYPSATCEIHKNTLFWSAKIQPTPLSREYSVRIVYKLGNPPHVWVFGKELQKLDDPGFPHKFDIDLEKQRVRICLYRYREFSSAKFLSKTIIPWTIEWLYYYEIWLATGEWCGGGEHPIVGGKKEMPSMDTGK